MLYNSRHCHTPVYNECLRAGLLYRRLRHCNCKRQLGCEASDTNQIASCNVVSSDEDIKFKAIVPSPTITNALPYRLTSPAKKSLFLPRKSNTDFTNSSGSCLCSVSREFRTGSCGEPFAVSAPIFPTVDAPFVDGLRTTDSSSSDKIAIGA